ncbi:hypothetical protein HB943_06085 [Listeria weihenstephanensis]|uniref:Uncharacterized protein n=1 Tax=Listeria weihenstephanensis TaxID=1006155 RepID=A0A841Z4I6_9LIST|nr:hypothetical protein [Listeria weihenstephanensis]MBC1500165.1 hypothetical protein [Listeria weihenstephanensis]
MFNKWNHFYDEHPYRSVLIAVAVSSVLGILIEYIVNRDFIGSAIYGTIFYTMILLFQAKRCVKKMKNRNEHSKYTERAR